MNFFYTIIFILKPEGSRRVESNADRDSIKSRDVDYGARSDNEAKKGEGGWQGGAYFYACRFVLNSKLM